MVRWMAVMAVAATLLSGGCDLAGERAENPVRIPDALPADVPLPDRAVLRMARDQGPKGITLGFETEAPLKAVAGGLRARLQEQGWVLLSELAVENAEFSSYRKSGRAVALSVSRVGEATVVGVSYREAAPAEGGDQG